MTVICNVRELYEAIANVSRAVFEKSTIPALEGIKVDVKETSIELMGYDLEIGIKTEIRARSTDKGQFIINPKLFGEIVRKMNTDEVTLEVIENKQLRVIGGETEYTVMIMSAEEFPSLPKKNDECEVIEVAQPILKNMIYQTIFAVSQTDTKPILKGELFEFADNVFHMVAIDGYRLAVRKESIKYGETTSFVVPSKALSEIAKLLKDDDELSCEIYLSRKHALFEFSGYTVYSRLLEGEFHNWRGSVPKTSATEVIIDRKELIQSLERAAILINERVKSPVRCRFENGELKLSCATSVGKINDKISVECTGPMIEIGFNCKFFLDPLKVIVDDKVKLLLNGATLPMKIVSLSGDDYTYLVLPVRIKVSE